MWVQSVAADPGCWRASPLHPASGPQPPLSFCCQSPGASDCQSRQVLGPAPSGDSAGPFFSLSGKSTALPAFPLPVLTNISSPVLSSQTCLSFDASGKVTVF